MLVDGVPVDAPSCPQLAVGVVFWKVPVRNPNKATLAYIVKIVVDMVTWQSKRSVWLLMILNVVFESM